MSIQFLDLFQIEPHLIVNIEKYLHNNDKLHLYQTSTTYSRIRSMITTYTFDDFIADKKRTKRIPMFDLFMLFGNLDIAFSALHSNIHTRFCDILLKKGAIRYVDCWSCVSELFIL